MKEPMAPQAMPMMGRDGGGAGTPGGVRTSAGIQGKAGGNVSPVYKPGSAGTTRPQNESYTTKGNDRGLKAANKDVVKPIMRRATKAVSGSTRYYPESLKKTPVVVVTRGPVQVSKAKAAKIKAKNAAIKSGN